MVTDHLCRIGWRCPPRSFVSLMTLYESNYIRLGWLISDLHLLHDRQVSHLKGDVSLHLEVLERSPYTSLFHLSHRFADGQAAETQLPDMQIRIYHDARVAEAHSCADSPHWAPELRNSLRGELDRRWERNMLLNKWLEYCVERGHRF